MNKRSLQFLETLVNTPSPSGHESRGLRVWMDYVSQYADETYSDAYGNCVAVLNKGGGPRLMLAGHADEIGGEFGIDVGNALVDAGHASAEIGWDESRQRRQRQRHVAQRLTEDAPAVAVERTLGADQNNVR